MVVGAGAAGLVAAVFAARGPAPVVVIERTADGGRKILISGGGRCNILPSRLSPEHFVTDSPGHLMRAMLRAWPLEAQRRFFEEEVGIPLALEAGTGKLFPQSNRARDVRDALIRLAVRGGVRFQFHTTVHGMEPEGGRWRIDTSAGPISASRVVLATGGLSVPATGSDGTGLRISQALGHAVHDTYPALTPLTVAEDSPAVARTPHVPAASDTPHARSARGTAHAPPAPRPLHPALLAGLSLPVRLRAKWEGRAAEAHGGFLFTHRGYSGPAVLDISHLCVRSLGAPERPLAQVRVSWSEVPAATWEEHFRRGDSHILALVARVLPERLALALMAEAGIPRDRRTSSLTRAERQSLVGHLTSYELTWTGHEGYKKAEVTGGGIALGEVAARTLESRHHPGLYLCGEMLDAFGPIGGYNFAWAWSTGRAAGLAAAHPRPAPVRPV